MSVFRRSCLSAFGAFQQRAQRPSPRIAAPRELVAPRGPDRVRRAWTLNLGEQEDTMPSRPRTLVNSRRDFLAEEGYRPNLDEQDPEDGAVRTVSFKSEGHRFVLFVYEDDPDYFNLGFAFDLGEGPHDPATLASMAGEVNEHVKGVKCTVAREDNSVRFQVETFLGGEAPTAALLERSLRALRYAAAQFFERRVPPEHLDA